jgi:hypothetical protein
VVYTGWELLQLLLLVLYKACRTVGLKKEKNAGPFMGLTSYQTILSSSTLPFSRTINEGPPAGKGCGISYAVL